MKSLFLLGGHDLEMETIKSLLIDNGQEFLDLGLSWENASLKFYLEHLSQYSETEYVIYGIELNTDNVDVPTNYIAINHHGEFESGPSSLEQVCSLLNVPLTRDLELISANDKAYIPGMKAIGASPEVIDDIRRRDRVAQGVTPEDEAKAEKDIKDAYSVGELIVVKSRSNFFSPIVDRLYPDTNHLLVYSSDSFCYYGKKRDCWLNKLKSTIKDINFYYGGGKNGFFGAGPIDSKKIKTVIQKIMSWETFYSGHIFMFPFSWDVVGSREINCLEQIKEKNEGNWVRTPLPKNVEDEDLYNEMNFFLPFTHDTIYDKEGDSLNIWHFERKELQSPNNDDAKYVIKANGKEYVLDLQSININLYETGVGLLCFYTRNSRYKEEKDILYINQLGRRLFLPYKQALGAGEVPESLELRGLNKSYIHVFSKDGITPNEPMTLVKDLINESVTNIDSISPVLDDRMFVMSWFKDDNRRLTDTEFRSVTSMNEDSKDFLYEYIFVDNGSPTCQNDEMKDLYLKESIYSRWQKFGTIYGVSRYSFVLLTNSGCPFFLLKYFETEYVRMVELALIQRASILRLSTLLRTRVEKDFGIYYRQYINFISRFRFPEVSAQEQGIELYDMVCKKMRIKENADFLDKQFNERENYHELQNQGKLNKLAGWAVPISIVSALFGFFFRGTLNAVGEETWYSGAFGGFVPGLLATLITAILTVFFAYYVRKKGK